MPVEELVYAPLAQAEAQDKISVLFAECNGPELKQYKAELEEQLPVMVEAVLMDELENRLEECISDTEPPWRLTVTTFYYVREVEKLVKPREK